ncbi:hypothetical protein, partial [Actinoallomurus acaciae]
LGPVPSTLDRVLVWALPAAALVLSRAAYSWFASPAHLLVTLGAWGVFAGVLRVLPRGHDRFGLCAAVGGAALVRTLVLLVALAGRGPGRYWYDFWTQPQARSVYITVAVAAFLWVPVAAYVALRALGARFTAPPVLAAAGTELTRLGVTLWAAGLETSLAVWNDQMALLPWGMHRILGITGFLDIPSWLPKLVTAAGGTLIAAGGLIAAAAGRPAGRRNPAPREPVM